MNEYFLLAASALALASCSSDDFLGENPGNGQNAANSVINFGGETGKTTRAGNSEGADAAELLENNFVLVGFKGNATDAANTGLAFDHYNVNYKTGTANSTESNTKNWEYVNQDIKVKGTNPSAALQQMPRCRPSNIGTTLAHLTTSLPSLWVRVIRQKVRQPPLMLSQQL